MKISDSVAYIGVNDYYADLFEGQYRVPNGMAYNSYVVKDDKIAVMDTVDKKFGGEWLGKLEGELGGRKPDYLVVQHMEPDHPQTFWHLRKNTPMRLSSRRIRRSI